MREDVSRRKGAFPARDRKLLNTRWVPALALIAAFAALQVADVLTTIRVLHAGGWEANPLFAWLIACWSWWPLAKLLPMAICAALMTRWPTRWIVPFVALMAVVVLNNAIQ